MTVGERIKKIRLEKGMTQKEVAEKCGINDANIRKYESGRQNPKLDTIEKIATALEVSPSELLDWNREIDDLDKEVLKIYPNFNPKYGYISDMVNGEYPNDVKYNNIRKDTITKYDSLNNLGQEEANNYITYLSEHEKYKKSNQPPEQHS